MTVSPRCMQSRTTSARPRPCSHRSSAARDHCSSSARHSARASAASSDIGVRFEQIAHPRATARFRGRSVATVMRMRHRPRREVVVTVVLALLVAGGIVGDGARARPARRRRPASRRDTAPPSTTSHRRRRSPDKDGVQHLHFEYGPLDIKPGQNVIETNKYLIPQPKEDGWIVGFKPNLQAGERQGAAGRRAPPAPRRVGRREPARHHVPALPGAVHRRRRGEDRARAPRAVRLPVPPSTTPGTSTT